MKNDSLFEILGDIDEKYILEAHEETKPQITSVTSVDASRRRKNMRTFMIIAGNIAAVALVGIGLWYGGFFGKRTQNTVPTTAGGITGNDRDDHKIIEHNSQVSDPTLTDQTELNQAQLTHEESNTTVTEKTIEETIEETRRESTDHPGLSGDETSGVVLTKPQFPSDLSIVLVGEPITNEEAEAFFTENHGFLKEILSSDKSPTDNLQFKTDGFCHISYEGVSGESLTIDQNIRDYFIYNGEDLIARITLFRVDGEDGQIHFTLGKSEDSFAELDLFLKEHRGEDLLFFYARSVEIIMTPDGTVMNPQGLDPDFLAMYFADVENPYNSLYNRLAIYTP